MKKYLSILLVLVLGISLAACGDAEEPVKEPDAVVAESKAEETAPPEEPEKPAESAATIEETVLVDEAGVKITAKSLELDEMFGPEIKLLIENNSGKDLTFQCRNASVNGYMTETMMSVDVVNGKKANSGLTFMEADLDACGIETIADMEFTFHIFDTAEWEDYLNTQPIRVETSAADTYEYLYDDSGDPVYEGNDVRIVVKGLVGDDIFGPGIQVYIENRGSRNLTVQVRDVSINGFMIDPIFSRDIAAGKCAVDSITFMEADLAENEITAIENVELSFHVLDCDSWNTIVDTEIVAITF